MGWHVTNKLSFSRKRVPGPNDCFHLVWMQRSPSFYRLTIDHYRPISIAGYMKIITKDAKHGYHSQKIISGLKNTACLKHIESLWTKYRWL